MITKGLVDCAGEQRSIIERMREHPAGAFVTLERLAHGGSLQARHLAGGTVQFYWRYSLAGRTFRESIGAYDSASPPKKLAPTERGFSIAAARERCRQLAARHDEHKSNGGLRGAKQKEREGQARAADRVAAASVAAAAEDEDQAARSLASLLDEYVKHQAKLGRISAREAKCIFDLHVVAAWPKLAKAAASELSQEQVVDMLRRLVEQDKGRTSNKLRTYLRAAYQCALDVRVTASIPVAFKRFGVERNPVSETRRDARFDRADKRPLSADELRRYWKLIEAEPSQRGRCLRLHLLTGGQRIEQFVRLRWSDVRNGTITIYDGKGRPGQAARAHVLPIVGAAASDVSAFEREGEFVLSTTSGLRPISNTTLSDWARAVSGDAIEGFQLKRVRSGVETLLAANGISREIRGHVQSHGLTGVQARHYDGHDYLPEKRQALEVLARQLANGAGRRKTLRPRRQATAGTTR